MINNNNNKYWKEFYSKNEKDLGKPSLFAKFVLTKLKRSSSLVDIACGNGRDSKFFEDNGIKLFSIDNSNIPFFLGKNFIKADALTFTQKSDAYYSRFFFHTINESQLVKFLLNISRNMNKKSSFFIETRSITGISKKNKEETFYKSGIGQPHYRMLYSLDYLSSLLSKYFEITYIEESDKFAPFRNNSSFIIRAILKKK